MATKQLLLFGKRNVFAKQVSSLRAEKQGLGGPVDPPVAMQAYVLAMFGGSDGGKCEGGTLLNKTQKP